jgi:hypothetical protein
VAGGGQDGYFDPNLVAHLGSSGTSARTTHTSREQDNSSNGSRDSGSDDDRGKTNDESVAKTKRKRRPKQKHQQASEDEGYASQAPGNDHDTSQGQGHQNFKTNKLGRNKNDMMTTMETLNDANNRIRSSSGVNDVQQSPAKKMNQFYSYHILPSKKVTIFSDQDLDSAPNEQIATYLRPNLR